MKIVEIHENGFTTERASGWHRGYEGVVVVLEDGSKIKIGIESGQSCCERYGYLTSEDDYSDFIGAEYWGVDVVNTALNTNTDVKVYEGDVMFVNIRTNEGVLQVVAYNDHNGYYGHNAVLIVNDIVVESQTL